MPSVLLKQLGHTTLLLGLQAVWVSGLLLFHRITDAFVEKFYLRAEGDFWKILTAKADWRAGWVIILVVPVICTLIFLWFSWRKRNAAIGWLVLACVQTSALFLGVMLVLSALMHASWALWW